jgi:hypothetical protein
MWALIFFITLLVVLAVATGADMRDERDRRDEVQRLYLDVYRREEPGGRPGARPPRQPLDLVRRFRRWRGNRL